MTLLLGSLPRWETLRQAPADRIGNEFQAAAEEKLAALASRASEAAQERTDEDAYDLANI